MIAAGGIDIGGLVVIAALVACVIGLVWTAWTMADAIEADMMSVFTLNDDTIGLHGAVCSAETTGVDSGKGGKLAGGADV